MRDGPDPETLLNLAQDKVVVLDEEGVYRHLNAATADVIGFDPEELVGTDAFDLVHPEDEARLRETFAAIVAGEAEPDEPFEYRYETDDGEWVWLRTRVHAPDSTGVDGYVLTSRDVTREVESRRRLETIASVSPDVFWMFTPDWSELLFINDAVEQVFDVSPERLEREPRVFLDAIHPEDRPYVERAMQRLSGGESTLIDYRLGTPDGATRWVRVPGEPVVEGGEVVAVTGFARDVTDEYRRDRQLAVMDNLLRHTIRNDMNIVDGTAERIVDRVADADAFDSKEREEAEPGEEAEAEEGAGVREESEAEEGAETGESDGPPSPAADPDELAELGADVAEHAETIRRIAADLLATAEKQRGVIDLLRQRGSPRSVEIAPVVEEAIDMVVDDCEGRCEVEVSYRESTPDRATADGPRDFESTAGGPRGPDSDDGGEDLASVSVSYPRDVQAFTHPELDYAIAELVENAIEHAESAPRVRIDVTEADESVEIAIRDNCPPIPTEERYVITDRWEMDDLRHTGGMGLWLVYWVANRSGGDLSFDTHADGNVVTLSVPSTGREPGAGSTASRLPDRPRTAVDRANPGTDGEGRGEAAPETGDWAETDGGRGSESDGTGRRADDPNDSRPS
ncbi:PAS domain-containing protein [Halorubrum sp. SD626R]|uniref:PAS domain-containing sensor histidine kinase n=1 Tax=Halorubrum sp. SD626R TaxID=1419722 RepID=UPI000A693C26|nr:PAS domain-containing protein [Halorubrum sp. SD626R]TKX79809.1 PAS domain S-box protein [Halorubrum sp. SD626R]